MKSPIAILIVRLVVALVFVDAIVSAQSLQHATLQTELSQITGDFDGRVGVCAGDSIRFTCVNGSQRFPLQSVMKLVVVEWCAQKTGVRSLNDSPKVW